MSPLVERWRPALILLVTLLAGCGEPAGTVCQITGSGFHASDPCRHKCLSRWQISCPDGERFAPGVCTGGFECAPGSCPGGQVCYHDDDPFDDRSFCVPEAVCGDLSGDVLERWELDTLERQEVIRRERLEKQSRRLQQPPQTSAPAAAVPDVIAETLKPTAVAQDGGRPVLPCENTPERRAFSVGPLELARGERFETSVPEGWRLTLRPVDHGWHLQLLDRPETLGAVDLSVVTPPLRGPVNARYIEGWHFRNTANDGPNTGEVNAPQDLRLFEFDPELIGTGGLRAGQASRGAGRGWLRIESLRLSPPAPGSRAHIEQMTIRGCLTWPIPDPAARLRWKEALDSSRAALQQNHGERPAQEIFGACGLDLDRFAIIGLEQLDLDGDDALDHAAAVRLPEGTSGVAVCRAGTWLDVFTPEHDLVLGTDAALTIGALESWRRVPSDHGRFGYEGEPPWPEMDGDGLALERREKSLDVLYMHGDEYRLHSVYRHVEP